MSLGSLIKKSFLSTVLLSTLAFSQVKGQAFDKNDAKSATFTLFLQTSFAVTGALINKRPIKEALKWGAITGTINYTAKYAAQRTDYLFWYSRFATQTSANLNMNFIEGYKAFERGNYSVYFFNVGWKKDQYETGLQLRINPEPIIGTLAALSNKPLEFDAHTTFRTGLITFIAKDQAYFRNFDKVNGSNHFYDDEIWGRYFAGTQTLKRHRINTATENHEFLHDLQLEETRPFTSLIEILARKRAKKDNKLHNYLQKRTIYQPWIFDISRTMGSPIYMLHKIKNGQFNEMEADIYHGRRHDE